MHATTSFAGLPFRNHSLQVILVSLGFIGVLAGSLLRFAGKYPIAPH